MLAPAWRRPLGGFGVTTFQKFMVVGLLQPAISLAFRLHLEQRRGDYYVAGKESVDWVDGFVLKFSP